MVDITPTDWAYAAGIIDGEGCITITHRKVAAGREYGLRLIVGQSDRRMLDWLTRFGGRVYVMADHLRRRRTRNLIFQWQLNGAKAAAVLVGVHRYLTIKKEQAELAIKFQSRLGLGRGAVTDLERRERHAAQQRLKAMKREFRVPLADIDFYRPGA